MLGKLYLLLKNMCSDLEITWHYPDGRIKEMSILEPPSIPEFLDYKEAYTRHLEKEGHSRKCAEYQVVWGKKCTCSITIPEDKKEESPFSKQVGGTYYKQYQIQPYEFFFKNKITHEKAAIIRRILRYDAPDGKGLEDLEKIKHECDLLIELNNYKQKEKEE